MRTTSQRRERKRQPLQVFFQKRLRENSRVRQNQSRPVSVPSQIQHSLLNRLLEFNEGFVSSSEAARVSLDEASALNRTQPYRLF